ncbi:MULTISPECIES: hypothetical protein [Brevundimonas]|uniref:hypothetical protein n=1 Tax=Brevundimonas TaxID=41275 RepID=UPI000F04009D|nr:hypothetical protein [Brevundimonas lutea]
MTETQFDSVSGQFAGQVQETPAEMRARAADLLRAAEKSPFGMDRAVLRGLAGEMKRRAEVADRAARVEFEPERRTWWMRLLGL